jgi:hypothetical protein
MWMGGVPPLGYGVQDHELVTIAGEADTVRLIFRRYAELGSVRLLKSELEARGIRSKSTAIAGVRETAMAAAIPTAGAEGCLIPRPGARKDRRGFRRAGSLERAQLE